jgi:hypothetical protein
VLVLTVYVGQASSHGVRPKAPGGDTLVGRAELVGRGRKTHELRRRMGWEGVENENENGNVLFGK